MFLCSFGLNWLLFTCSPYCNYVLTKSRTNQPCSWWLVNQWTFQGWPNQWFPERGSTRDHKGCLRRNQQVPQQNKDWVIICMSLINKVGMWNDLSHGLRKIFTNESPWDKKPSMWIHGWFVVVFGNTSWERLGLQSPTQFSGAGAVLVMQWVDISHNKAFYGFLSAGNAPLTVCLQLVCHLVDFTLKSRISGKLVHHADGSLLLLHLLDFSPHLALLFGIFLHHLRELGSDRTWQTMVSTKAMAQLSWRWQELIVWRVAECCDVPTRRLNINLAVSVHI